MNILAFNTQLPDRLIKKVKFRLGFLPIGLMFSAFIPLFMFSNWLAEVLGIASGVAVKDQPNGGIWLIIFLAAVVAMMIAGYCLGWILNALGLRFLFGWSPEKVSRLMFYSDVPPHWLLEDEPTNIDGN